MGGLTFSFARFLSVVNARSSRVGLVAAFGLAMAVVATQAFPQAANANVSSQVGNTPPTADIGGPYLIEEGSTGALDGSGSSDSDGDIDTFEWDLDNDGVFGEIGAGAANGDETGPNPTFDASDLDGPLAHPIALRVIDDVGDSDSADSTVSVLNVAVANAGGPYIVDEGGVITLNGSSDDPAPADTQEFAWDFSDDDVFDDATGADAEFSAALLDGPGEVTVTLRVTDDDGGTADSQAKVTINNVAPSVTVLGDAIEEGQTATVTLGFTDPSTLDTHTAMINWGDGSAVEDLGVTTSPVDATHVYGSPGEYTVTATVTDSDGGVGEGSSTVQVATSTPDLVQIINSTGDLGDLTPLDGICWTGDVNSEDAPECTLRAAIEQSNFTAGFNAIEFDVPDSDAGYDSVAAVWAIQPSTSLPAVIDTVSIDGYTQVGASPNTAGPGSGLDTVITIEIDGSGSGITVGLMLLDSNNDLRGFAIGGFANSQIVIADTSDSNVIQGAFIGTDASGAERRDGGDGINVHSSGNVIGGDAPANRNLISGNDGSGIVVEGSDDDDSGVVALSGGSAQALQAASGNVISGNIIGLAADGVTALGNGQAGIRLTNQANENLIGGFSPEDGNVISGNSGAGVLIELSSSENQVSANIIGADVSGTVAVGNGDGIALLRADDNLVGGSSPEMANLISGNFGNGISLITEFILPESGMPENTIIQGNLIGSDISGEAPLGNTGHGIFVGNAPGTLIGGTNAEDANVIAFNDGDGVRIDYPLAGVSVRGNSIHSNGGLGIDLDGDGVTFNDPGDGDEGPNDLQNFPVLQWAVIGEDTLEITGYLDTTFAEGYIIEFFVNESCDPGTGHGEGQLFLSSILVTPRANGIAEFSESFAISLPKDIYITATATHPNGSTSEFSECAVTTGAPPVADAGGPYEVNEGGSITLDGSGSTDPDNEIEQYAWDFDGDEVTDAIGEAPLFDATALDGPNVVVVTLTVTDEEGLQSSATVEVTVLNVAPSVSVTGDSIDEDQPATVGINFSDGGEPDSHSVVIDWGDGSDPEDLGIVTSPQERSHLYDEDGSYTVTVTVTDDDGAVGEGSAVVEVAAVNEPPTANAGGPYEVEEGSSITLDGSGSTDSDGSVILFEWDFDGDEITDATGETVTFDAASIEAPESFEITLTVTDDGGESASDTAFLAVIKMAVMEPQQLMTKIDSSEDDAFHSPGGWPHYSDTSMLVYAGTPGGHGPTYGGFRWDELNIPDGAIILEVRVELMQKNWGYEIETNLAFEDSAHSQGFTRQTSPYMRWKNSRTDFQMPWTADLRVPGSWIKTPDLSEGLQELVNRYGGIDSLTLLESGEGVKNGEYHEWRAFDINPHTAPRLHIRYLAPNAAPYVEAGPDQTITEGDQLKLHGASFVDGSDGDFTSQIDWGDGTVEPCNVNGRDGSIYASHHYQDNGVYTVTISVTDPGGLTGTDTMTVTVNNAKPVVDAGSSRSAETGVPLSLSPARFTDAGLFDTHTALIDWGDGVVEPGTVGQNPGYGSVAGSHVYDSFGAFHVEVCVTDDDGATGCDTFSVVVEPQPGDIQEAWSTLISGSDDAYHSPNGWPHYSDSSAVIYAGSPDGSGATYGGWRWTGLDIPEGAVILSAYVELTQANWGYDVTTTLALQDNIAPETFTGRSTPFDRWADRTEFETSWSWPRSAPNTRIHTPDLGAGLQELIDRYGSLDALVLLESGEGTVNGEYHEWRASEAGAQYAPKLHVRYVSPNVAPVVDAGRDQAAVEGQTVSLEPVSFDDTTVGGYTAMIDWGDSVIEPGIVDPVARTVSGSHVYGDNGTHTVTVTVTDNGSLSGSDEFDVVVSNADPVVYAGDSVKVDEGEAVGLPPARFTDPGFLDTHTSTIDWGDGTSEPGILGQGYGNGTVAGSHVYTGGGVFTVEVCLTDDNGGVGCDSFEATVVGAPQPQPLQPEWDGIGQVLFVGPSPDPSAITLTSADFDINEDGSISQVVIETENEFVAGALFGGLGGGALTACRDAEGGASCEALNAMLTGATVTSLHTSTATLANIVEAVIQVPLETPDGVIVLDVPIVSGSLVGQLEGLFIISQGADSAIGTASMQINPGSFGTYACFQLTELGPVPLTTLEPCIAGVGGQFYPIILDVIDSGTFVVGQGTGALSDIAFMSGSVEVAAQSNLLIQQFGGTITITDAITQLGGSEPVVALGETPDEGVLINSSRAAIALRSRREDEGSLA